MTTLVRVTNESYLVRYVNLDNIQDVQFIPAHHDEDSTELVTDCIILIYENSITKSFIGEVARELLQYFEDNGKVLSELS